MTSKLKFLVAASTLPALIMNASSAYAAGTLVGTDITNNVSVAYKVGTVDQTAATDSNTFEVDRKILFTVAEDADVTTPVVPNQQNAWTTFVVTNTSNDTLDFSLSPTQLAGVTATHGGTDNFNVQNLQVFVDSNGNNVFDGADTATSINNLAPDASVRVFIVGDVLPTQINGDVAGVTLTATALNSDGSAITAATDATANTDGVETIFADTGRDGIESDQDDFTVSTASLTVSKLSRVVRDNLNGSGTSADPTNPKAVPGATVEYCIVVVNSGSQPATDVTVSDDLGLVPDVTFDSSFTPATNGTVVSGNTCTAGGGTGSFAANVVSGTLTDIAGGETRTLVFRVTID
ncbi:MAG: DUF11 domain-containing protein [Sphingomonadales bacterium]|nr:DUF11 domain-containing protein [Sphingomonadales bacterium]MBK9268629.1 DUF11 domain-containing protein [Sphingomonadales bacterium]